MRFGFGLMMLLAAALARGAEQGKYAQAAAEERDLARATRDAWVGFIADLQRYEAFVKEDAKLAEKDVEAEAQYHEQAAKAFDADDVVEGRRLRELAGRQMNRRMAWKDRIYEYRRRQAESAPSEQFYAEERRWSRWDTRTEFDAFTEAKKAVSEAWGRVAEVAGPDRDLDSLTELKEAAFAAEMERDIAEMRYTWAKQREEIWADKKVSSPQLQQSLGALQAVQEKRVQLRRTEALRDREDRRIEREIRLAVEAYRKAYDEAAKAEREKAEREKAAVKK